MRQSSLFPEARGRMGTDESGKGDYYGPLTVAGFFLPEGQDEVLLELGIRDSKKISDNRVRELSDLIKSGYIHTVVAIGPEKYNELYEKLRNLNRLLAWAHSRAIENLLEEVPCTLAITDQFGDKAFVLNALMKKGRNIELIQKPKAEEDLAVAAASILARAEFLKRLYFLSQDVGIDLPKGASAKTEEVGIALIQKHGIGILDKVAKKHFKITGRILSVVNSKK
jgi:ribonuclease HIII